MRAKVTKERHGDGGWRLLVRLGEFLLMLQRTP